jgi:hypothetical protein
MPFLVSLVLKRYSILGNPKTALFAAELTLSTKLYTNGELDINLSGRRNATPNS